MVPESIQADPDLFAAKEFPEPLQPMPAAQWTKTVRYSFYHPESTHDYDAFPAPRFRSAILILGRFAHRAYRLFQPNYFSSPQP